MSAVSLAERRACCPSLRDKRGGTDQLRSIKTVVRAVTFCLQPVVILHSPRSAQ